MAYFAKKAGLTGGASTGGNFAGGGGSGAGAAKKYSKVSSYVCMHDGARAIVTLKNQVSHWYREDLVPFTLKKDAKVDTKDIQIGGQSFSFYPEGVPIRTNRGEWVLPGGQHDKMADETQHRDLVVARWRDETGCSINSSNNNGSAGDSPQLSIFGIAAESVSIFTSPCGRFAALRLKFQPAQLDSIVASMNAILEHPDRIELSTRVGANDVDEADADDINLIAYANRLLCDDLKRAEVVEFTNMATYFSNATSQGWFSDIVANVNASPEAASPESGDKDKEKKEGDKPSKYVPKTGGSGGSKTTPCTSFVASGFCKFGESCRFLHSKDGAGTPSSASSEGSWKSSPSTSPRSPVSSANSAAKSVKDETDGWATVAKPIRPQTKKDDKSPKGPSTNIPRGPNDKKVTFFKQGEAVHNASHDTTIVDPGLTEKGKAQVEEKIHGLYVKQADRPYMRQAPEIIVVSPMRRCLETAKALKDIQPKIVAEELCRGECSKKNVDRRQTISEKKAEFPFVDFSSCTNDEDTMFGTEDDEEDKTAQIVKVRARAAAFLTKLAELKEKDIVVISHCKFIKSLMCHVNDIDLESNVEGLKHGSHATFYWSPERGWEVSAVNVKVVPREAPKKEKVAEKP